MKKILALFITLSVLFALASCGGCDSHIDKDDDLKCDSCGADYDDGNESGDSSFKSASVNIYVRLDNGEALPGVKLTITKDSTTYSLTCDNQGKVFRSLEVGTYMVTYHGLGETHEPASSFFTVNEGDTEIVLTIINTVPDGSADKPFTIHKEPSISIDLQPGEEVYYLYTGGHIRHICSSFDGIVISFDGVEHIPSDGHDHEHIVLDPALGADTLICIKNTSSEAIVGEIDFEAPMGSFDNPLSLGGVIIMDPEQELNYKWTSTVDGVLVFTNNTASCNAVLTRVSDGEETDDVITVSGIGAAYMHVEQGDDVIVTLTTSEFCFVGIGFNAYTGLATNPILVAGDGVTISLGAGESLIFKAEGGKTLSASGVNDVSFTVGITNYKPDDSGNLSVTLTPDGMFTLTNLTDETNEVTIEIK